MCIRDSSTTHGAYGHTTEMQVVAINDRARALLGAEPQWVPIPELVLVSEEELR